MNKWKTLPSEKLKKALKINKKLLVIEGGKTADSQGDHGLEGGGRCWVRTSDRSIKSRMLYQLS